MGKRANGRPDEILELAAAIDDLASAIRAHTIQAQKVQELLERATK